MHTESSFNSPSAVQTGAEENASFEDAYRHYEFAPLVAAAIAAAEWLTRKRQRSAIRRAAPADPS
jgi:hypothetical protein